MYLNDRILFFNKGFNRKIVQNHIKMKNFIEEEKIIEEYRKQKHSK